MSAVGDAIRALKADGRANKADALSRLGDVLPEALAVEVVPPVFPDALALELAVRMAFSALCDADFLDTEAHFASREALRVAPKADFVSLFQRWSERRDAFVARRAVEAGGVVSPMDRARAEVYRACLEAAAGPRGMYRLAAGTGAAKTIGAGGFAVRHAALQGMSRVVVAVPFTTVTEQNAEVYRDLLGVDGEQVVLEHHSGVDVDPDDPKQSPRWWERTAAENWDAPFVVTTTVQLFESLFARRPSPARKLHRLAGSVIVLDEVQALPPQMLVPILSGLRGLVEHFGCTVLLSTATQPDFWSLAPFQQFPFTDIALDPVAMAPVQDRVTCEWWPGERPTLADVAEAAAGDGSALVIVNRTKDARAVAAHWRKEMGIEEAWHLSKLMGPQHRRRVLASVRQRLRDGKPVLLVSTSLIEAGVDVDFPTGYRAVASADSYVQSAGRVNREGLRSGGRLVIFDPVDGGMPPSMKTAAGRTKVWFGPGKADLGDASAHLRYWRDLYRSLNVDAPGGPGRTVQKSRAALDFQAVTDGPLTNRYSQARDPQLAFRMIDDQQITVLVPQSVTAFNDDPASSAELERISRLIQDVRAGRDVRGALRALQPYATTVHHTVLRDPGVLALMKPVLGDPREIGSLVEWTGTYDEVTGIKTDNDVEDWTI